MKSISKSTARLLACHPQAAMIFTRVYQSVWRLLILSCLQACTEERITPAFQQQIEQIINQPSGNITPLPAPVKATTPDYTGNQYASPFSRAGQSDNRLTPTNQLSEKSWQITMAGTIRIHPEEQTSALIRDQQGNIYKRRTGELLPDLSGRIIRITHQQIEVKDSSSGQIILLGTDSGGRHE
ncbi:pilus assembly protein PilP [Oceanospirillum sediminis]|uniref:Pilus assembly protein PilP n=1 Tax=Oceanospirillum sediminis TaxID=2760088 RepID=A0A839IRJ3_9GAMM|nr:pilus assembly protein PilP [Oceanospirillum sediminis]MBB1487935.1 pilus assembly protein PilP [Oceanospirillum sediminis]